MTQTTIEIIKKMTREEMASLWRFAPAEHPYFNKTLPYWEVFEKRFKKLDGMSPEISKKIGIGMGLGSHLSSGSTSGSTGTG